MSLGSHLEELLSRNGITQRELADALHLSPSTINGYVRNRRTPDPDTLSHIASFFDISLDYLVDSSPFHSYLESDLDTEENILISNYRGMDSAHQRCLLEISDSFYKRSHTYTEKKNSGEQP